MTARTMERSGRLLSMAPRHPGARERGAPATQNVGDAERGLTGLLAGVLLLKALARPSGWSIPLGLVAGALGYRALRGFCPLYHARGLRTAAESGDQAGPATSEGALVIDRSVCVERPREEVYRFWRNLSNVPRFISRVQAVEVGPDETSHWTARGPAGVTLRWDARLTADVPGERLAWATCDGSPVRHDGTVAFEGAPEARATRVHVRLRYEPVGGKLGTLVATLVGEDPARSLENDLRRLKQILEAGEVATAARRRS